MAHRLIVLPVAVLLLAAAGIGLSLGLRAVGITETEVIDRVAARYVREAGEEARHTDCAARPAASAGLWLLITCGRHEYFVDDRGRLVHVNLPDAAS